MGSCSTGSGRARAADRRRAAPRRRRPRGALESLLQRHSRGPCRSRTTRRRSSRVTSTSRPPDYHLLVDGRRFALSVDGARPVRAAVDRRAVRVGRRGLPRARDRDRADRRERGRRRAGSPRSSGAAASAIVQDPRTARRSRMPEAAIAAGAGRRGPAARARSAASCTGCAASDERRARSSCSSTTGRRTCWRSRRSSSRSGRSSCSRHSGEEALRHLLHDEFAAILLDVQMPGLDGFETAELIKERERTRHVPIIFLTAISKDAEHVFRGYEAGAVDYLMKPFDPQILRAKVAVFIDLWQKTVEISAAGRAAQAAGDRDARAGERAALPVPRGRGAADRLDDGRRRRDDYFNERWYEYIGSQRGEPDRRGGAISSNQRDLPTASSAGRRARTGEPFEMEYRLRRADGDWRWHLVRAVAVRDDEGDDHRLGRHRDRHRGPPARRGAADASSPRPAGCSAARSTTSRTLARRGAARGAGGSRTGAPSTSSSDGRLQRLAVEHVDRRSWRSRARAPRADARRILGGRRDRDPVRSRRSFAEITDVVLAARGSTSASRDRRELGAALVHLVPLVARDDVLGAITFVTPSPAYLRRGRANQFARELARACGGRSTRRGSTRGRGSARRRRGCSTRSATASSSSTATASSGSGTPPRGDHRRSTRGRAGTRSRTCCPAGRTLAPWIRSRARRASRCGRNGAARVGGREIWLSGSGVGFDEGTVYAFRDLTEERALEAMKATSWRRSRTSCARRSRLSTARQ